MKEFCFTITGQPGHFAVELQVGGQSRTGEFTFDENGSAVAAALDEIARANPSRETIKHVGEELWVGLANDEVLALFKAEFQHPPVDHLVRLHLPYDLRWLPWESLYYRDFGYLCGEKGVAVVHIAPDLAHVAPYREAKAPPIRLLLVIPQRTKLNVQPEREAIVREMSKVGVVEVLDGVVDADRLDAKLREGWDIFHFIGHGTVNPDGAVEIGLNDAATGENRSYDGEDLSSSLAASGVRLAIMNSCHGNAGADPRGLTGFGPLFQRRGVPAVISMQYAINNDMACQFSVVFYEQLFGPGSAGRVDQAVEQARAALRRTAGPDLQRSFITPVIHLAPGHERLFAIQPPARSAAIVKVAADVEALPEKLALAIRQGRCVPVIGPGILCPAMTRDHAGSRSATATTAAVALHPHGPRELAQLLARELPPYPRLLDLSLCDTAGSWVDDLVLQWVSQHRESLNDGRGEIIRAFQEHYAAVPAPPLIAEIARWRVPAIFYTHFDGYLEARVKKGESYLTNLVYEYDKALTTTQAGSLDPRSLVLLRGSLAMLEVPLVLTEDDHDTLALRLAKLDPQLRNAARGAGRSALFLGVDPRDPIVRLLSQQLLVSGKNRLQGPTYFSVAQYDAVDEAYWAKFNTKWLAQDLATLVHQISAAMPTE